MNRDSALYGAIRRFMRAYNSFVEKSGFYVVLGVCVGVIVLSALYTSKMRHELENPSLSPVAGEAAQSASSAQGTQSLIDVERLFSSYGAYADEAASDAQQSAFSLAKPSEGRVSRKFSLTQPVYFDRISAYAVHAAIDIEGEYGSLIAACADGRVTDVYSDDLLGLCVKIEHTDGYETVYAGLSDAGYARAGDTVRKGQTIAHMGNGVLAEGGDPPHLHLIARKHGKPVDPAELFILDGIE